MKGWFGEKHRHYLASKGITTNKRYFSNKNDVEKYLSRELGSRSDGDFIGPVKQQFIHPVSYVDRTWMAMERAAGQDGKMSSDPSERNVERGAAIFGQIVTQGSAVPLENPRRECSEPARTQGLDMIFGDDADTGNRYLSRKDEKDDIGERQEEIGVLQTMGLFDQFTGDVLRGSVMDSVPEPSSYMSLKDHDDEIFNKRIED